MEPLFALLLVLAIAGAFFWLVGAICCGIVRMFVGLFRAMFGLGGRDAEMGRMQSMSPDFRDELSGMRSRDSFAVAAYHGKGMTMAVPRRCTNRNCRQTNPGEASYCGRCGAALSPDRRGVSDWVRL